MGHCHHICISEILHLDLLFWVINVFSSYYYGSAKEEDILDRLSWILNVLQNRFINFGSTHRSVRCKSCVGLINLLFIPTSVICFWTALSVPLFNLNVFKLRILNQSCFRIAILPPFKNAIFSFYYSTILMYFITIVLNLHLWGS